MLYDFIKHDENLYVNIIGVQFCEVRREGENASYKICAFFTP